MELRITIPDDKAPRVLAAFSQRFGYAPTLPDGTPNPQTEAQFAREQVKGWIRETVRAQEEDAAVLAAREDAAGDVLAF